MILLMAIGYILSLIGLTWISWLTLVIASGVTWAIYNYVKNYGKKFPPGPQWIPVVGNAMALGNSPHLAFTNWARKYGNIFQMYIGSNRVVVLSDARIVKEAFNDPNLNGRVDSEFFHLIQGGPFGILTAQGQAWKEQRQFTVKHLREFGFGQRSMEILIKEEVEEFIAFLKSYEEKQQAVAVKKRFNLAVVNSLWMITTGKRYKHDDPKLTRLLDRVHEFEEEAISSLAFKLPWIAKLLPKYSGWDKIMSLVEDMRSMYREHIVEHENNVPQDDCPRDLIDAYLKKIRETKDPDSSFFDQTGKTSLIAVVADLFGAGSETTYLTLSWAVLYLSKFEHVQKKLQDELDDIVGRSRAPLLSDRQNLPYTEATILEILRLSNVAPIGLFHTAMTDVSFQGFHIPQGTWICANFYGIHTNEFNWENPQEFNPQRFLHIDEDLNKEIDEVSNVSNTDTNTSPVIDTKLKPSNKLIKNRRLKRPETFLPFSTGKRVCIGETFAKDEIFLFVTNIFHRFTTTLNESSGSVSLESKPAGIALSPQDYEIFLKDRLL